MEFLPLALSLEWTTLPQQLVNGLLLGMIYALVALGYTMVYGVLKLINFAHSEVFMIGSYAALFTSWAMGYAPSNANPPAATVTVLVAMLLSAMVVCGLLGAVIERFAYRPLRNQPRITSLITAIGLSLLLQYGGQIFLPLNQSISDKANVLTEIKDPASGVKGTKTFVLRQGESGNLDLTALRTAAESTEKSFRDRVANKALEPNGQFDLTPEGRALRDAFNEARSALREAEAGASKGRVELSLPYGRMVSAVITLVLMAILTYLVLYTKTGRAMRAVSHDFDAAGLMGIPVDRIVTFTFVLGSMLAGAAAMMVATFYTGTKIDPFFGAVLGIKAFVAAVLGGIGNIPGAVLGALLMGVTESLVVWAGYDGYKDAVAFIVLIVVLLVRPGGLLGSAKVEKV